MLDHIEGAPSETTAWLLKRKYTDYLRSQVSFLGWLSGTASRRGTRRTRSFSTTVDAARQFPQAFAAGVWEEYWKLIGNGTFITAAQKEEFDSYVATHPPVLPPAYPSGYPNAPAYPETTCGILHQGHRRRWRRHGSSQDRIQRAQGPLARLILGLKFIQYGAWVLSVAAIVAILSAASSGPRLGCRYP